MGLFSSLFGTMASTYKCIQIDLKSNNKLTSLKGNSSAAANIAYSLPVNDGSDGQVLKTNGSATLSWTTLAATYGIVTKTADATLSATEFKNGFIKLDGTSAVVGITFPSATDVTGYICILKCINSVNVCSIASNVDGTTYTFSGENDVIIVISDGTYFWRIA